MLTTVAFDLDGTLVETEEALARAYEDAGATYRPNEPWRYWCTPEQHAHKNRVYPHYLSRFGRVTPLGELFDPLDPVILTGASDASVVTVRRCLGLRLRYAITGLDHESKINWLQRLGVEWYVDDDLALMEKIRCITRPR